MNQLAALALVEEDVQHLAPRQMSQMQYIRLALSDRDFNSNDYSDLLALDSDNIRPAGLSQGQCNRLPSYVFEATTDSGKESLRSAKSELVGSVCGNEEKSAVAVQISIIDRELETILAQPQHIDIISHTSRRPLHMDSIVCVICLETIVTGDFVRSTPCVHIFHAACLDPWLKQKPSCPVCQRNVAII